MNVPLAHPTRLPLEAPGAFLDLSPGFLPADEARTIYEQLQRELAFEQREIVLYGRRILQPRLIAWAGDLGYRYSGQTLEPRAWTPTLLMLRARVCATLNAPDQLGFNHVLVNLYRSGDDSMGFHADNEPELGDDPIVATLSLGATRRFVVKARAKSSSERRELALTDGTLLTMSGPCQRLYLHGVPRAALVQQPRMSLTWRRLLRAPGG
jgi:alkylated DNA repair dioxygenase AlkB